MTDLVTIPFHGTDVLTTEIDGEPHVVLRPIIEAFGLDFRAQHRKLQRKSWATVAVTAMVGADGKRREMVTVPMRTLTMLLATIPEERVSESARPLLVAYQSEVADVIEAYWTKGGAINPRATEDQLADVISIAERQIGVLNAAKGLLPADWLATKAKIVTSRALGEAPQIEQADLPMYVDDYLGEKELTKAQITALRSQFGRKLSQAHYEHYGHRPEKAPGEVNGRPRQINVYYGRDRHLFDRVWDERFAAAFDDLFGGAA